jgi:hypothetical protein
MLKNTTYKEKLVILSPWMNSIIESIKKDLRNEHLRKDPSFVRHYFPGGNVNKLLTEDLAKAYTEAIANSDNAEELAEFISNRWVFKHSDLYHYFEEELSRIDRNFNELEILDKELSVQMMEGAIQHFGAKNTWLFCVLNSVVFPEEVFEILGRKADAERSRLEAEAAVEEEMHSLEAMQSNYEQRLARLSDKYEKKLQGMQKKYTCDVEILKKQIAALQRKLAVHEQ